MKDEINALERNGGWNLKDLPTGKKAMGVSFKYRSNGEEKRLKACLIVHSNQQVEVINFNETFALVAKMGTIRLFPVVAISCYGEIHQMDVCSTFLHGDSDEKVYMCQPDK